MNIYSADQMTKTMRSLTGKPEFFSLYFNEDNIPIPKPAQYKRFLLGHSHLFSFVDFALARQAAEKEQKDQLHPALNHGGEMKEILMDYGGDRDVHRHRRGASTTQTLTPYHGAEIPPEISLAGLQRVFLAALAEMHNAYIEVSGENQHVAQLMTTMAHRRRRLVSWQLGQDGYFVELRGRREGHDSYRAIAHELVGLDACVFPLVAAHLHVDRRTYPPGLTKAARDWYDTTKRNV